MNSTISTPTNRQQCQTRIIVTNKSQNTHITVKHCELPPKAKDYFSSHSSYIVTLYTHTGIKFRQLNFIQEHQTQTQHKFRFGFHLLERSTSMFINPFRLYNGYRTQITNLKHDTKNLRMIDILAANIP